MFDKVKTMATTHYPELKLTVLRQSLLKMPAWNLTQRLEPDLSFHARCARTPNAFEIARRLGLAEALSTKQSV